MTNTKLTKKAILEAVKAAAQTGADFGEVVSAEDVIAFADTTIAQLEAKAAKAKEKAAEKKADGDALRAAVAAVLTNEYQTIADIASQVEGEDITPAKVSARLTQLVKMGEAEKETIKVNDRKLMGYKKA